MKGILFKPDMIKAIVEGRKTVTRRLIKPEPFNRRGIQRFCPYEDQNRVDINLDLDADLAVPFARYKVGEVVYIKEAWCEDSLGATIHYKLDGGESPGPKIYFGKDRKWHDYKHLFWRSPMCLKAKDARYFIKIEDVRPERLQSITEEDALKEGIEIMADTWQKIDYENLKLVGEPQPFTARYHYEALWNSINGDGSWESNPWVWRIEFKPTPGIKG